MNSLSDNQITVYEEPVHERIRKFIKLELLFNKIIYFKDKDYKYENYSALTTFSELYEILVRSDIKSELIRELENQNTIFTKIKDMPGADNQKLTSILEKQEMLLKLLYDVSSNYLDYLEHDILFKEINKNYYSKFNPTSIEFWLSRDIAFRNDQIQKWLEPILFIKKSIDFILEIIRKSGKPEDRLAEKGFFIEKINQNRSMLLLRITLTSDLYYFPKISLGKQRINIMFMTKDDQNNFIQYQEDVSFLLTLCRL